MTMLLFVRQTHCLPLSHWTCIFHLSGSIVWCDLLQCYCERHHAISIIDVQIMTLVGKTNPFLAFMCGSPADGSSVTPNALFKSVDPSHIHFTTSLWRRFLLLSPLLLRRQSMEDICLYHMCPLRPRSHQSVMRYSHYIVPFMLESVVWVGMTFLAWRNMLIFSDISLPLQYDDILVRFEIPDSKIVWWRKCIKDVDQNMSREPCRWSPPLFTIGFLTNFVKLHIWERASEVVI